MKKPPLSGKPSKRASLKTRLVAYSATAGAALAAAGTTDAAITNISDQGIAVNFSNGQLDITLNAGPFHALFHVKNTASEFGTVRFSRTNTGFLTGNANIAGAGGSAFNLPGGVDFTALNFIVANQGHGMLASNFKTPGSFISENGSFAPFGRNSASTGYIALKAGTNSTLKYGWLRVRVRNSFNYMPVSFSLIAKDGEPDVFGAWDLASTTVADGFKVGVSASPVPEPSTMMLGGLGLLALGAAGVREMRRRRKN